jgi:cysteine desulfurase
METAEGIYLDYQATTPVDPRVLEAMLPFFSDRFGNPASVQHAQGNGAREAVELAREQVATLVGADRREIVFCSGATEANNLALKGLAEGADRRHLVVGAAEHPAVLDVARALAGSGFELTELPVDKYGQVSLPDLEGAVTDRTLLVSVAAANNEIGTLAPLREIAAAAHSRGALLHTDAAQAAGKIEIDVGRDGIDLLSISAHKMYGPKGAGALYVKRELQERITPLLIGGGHERGLRSGTTNAPGVVAMGSAAALAAAEDGEADRLRALAERLFLRLRSTVDGLELNGPPLDGARLPGNLNLRFPGVDAEALMANCPELAFSAGSACSAATPTPSHVLTAIGLGQSAAEESVRLGVGRPTTAADVDRAADLLAAATDRIRQASLAPMGAH